MGQRRTLIVKLFWLGRTLYWLGGALLRAWGGCKADLVMEALGAFQDPMGHRASPDARQASAAGHARAAAASPVQARGLA